MNIVNTHRSRSEGSNTRDDIATKPEISGLVINDQLLNKEIPYDLSKVSIRDRQYSRRTGGREKSSNKNMKVS